jgi:hypothetical protein
MRSASLIKPDECLGSELPSPTRQRERPQQKREPCFLPCQSDLSLDFLHSSAVFLSLCSPNRRSTIRTCWSCLGQQARARGVQVTQSSTLKLPIPLGEGCHSKALGQERHTTGGVRRGKIPPSPSGPRLGAIMARAMGKPPSADLRRCVFVTPEARTRERRPGREAGYPRFRAHLFVSGMSRAWPARRVCFDCYGVFRSIQT